MNKTQNNNKPPKPGDWLVYWIKFLNIIKVKKVPGPRRENSGSMSHPGHSPGKLEKYLIKLIR